MTIRGRLQLILVLCAGVVVMLSALLLRNVQETRTLAHAPQAQLATVRRANVLGDAAARVMKEMFDVVHDAESDVEASEALDDARRTLGPVLASARDDRARELAAELAASFHALEVDAERVLQLIRAGQLEHARVTARMLGETVYEQRFRDALVALQRHEDDVATANEVRANRTATRSTVVAIVLVAIGITTLVLAVLIVLGIRRRIARLTAAVTSIKSGATARAGDTSSDELGQLAHTFNQMADDLDRLVETRAQKEALASELALSAHLQQALLPRAPLVLGLDIAGAMTTATEVGGDYYDVIPTSDGAWICIGDVSGHGFNAGIVMLMAQAAVAAAVRAKPSAAPSEILRLVNAVLYDNVRERLGRSEHMTLSVLRYHDTGVVEFAGAHQEIIVRGPDGGSRTIETHGPWMGILPDLDHLEDHTLVLAPGEAMVLFTDGVVEARADDADMFGIERLVETIRTSSAQVARGVRDAVFARLDTTAAMLDDDATVLVIRRLPAPAEAAA